MSEIRLSAVVLTKNEESRITRCLASLSWVDDVVVVDDESTDRTREICQEAGARVLVRRSEGDFDQQRNAGIEAARGTWILQLDADEVVSAALREEIRQVLEHSNDIDGYRLRRVNYFLGHPMRYGGWGWQGVKLFRKSTGRYLGHSVHETLVVTGSIADLTNPIDYFPFQSLTQFLERQNFYSDVEARWLRQTFPTVSSRTLQYYLLIRPIKLFWKSYLKKSGWREGLYGLVFAALFAWVHFLKWAKYWALGLSSQQGSTTIVDVPPTLSGARSQNTSFTATTRRRLSVVVLTKNEEGKIAQCLESVQWADEIIVVDGLSTDRTVEICKSFGATVIAHAFDGSFSTDRNLGLAQAQGEWILQIDADDVVTPGFRRAVEELLQTSSPHAALKFRRRSVLLGRVMRYGGWYYSVPNLLRRGRTSYEGVVHERPVVNGTIGELTEDIEHHPCENLSTFVVRQNRYTSLQAQELVRVWGPQSERVLKYRLWKKPWKTFWKSYIKKAGYREGLHGLVFAEFYAGIEFLKWAKYWERICVAGVLDRGSPASSSMDRCGFVSAPGGDRSGEREGDAELRVKQPAAIISP